MSSRGKSNSDNENKKGKENGNGLPEGAIEKDGMICFPKEAAPQAIEQEKPKEKEQGEEFEYETCPSDPRFQQQNVTKWCYRMYIDYQRCAHLLGGDTNYCQYFFKCYHSLCPNSWHEKWDAQIEAGTFPRDITRDIQAPEHKKCKE